MDKIMKEYAKGIYFKEFEDGSKLFMIGLPFNFRNYNWHNTNKFLRHFKMTDKKIAKTRQKHTKNVVLDPRPGEYVNVDGFVSKDTPIMVVTADCIPILIKEKETRKAALLHSGWRGVQKRIYYEALRHMGRREDLSVYILPSIAKKSFQVSEDFLEEFEGRFRFGQYLSSDQHEGKYLFDLSKFVKKELIDYGIEPHKIFIDSEDTYDSPRYHSYRREKEGYGLNAIIYVP